VHDGDAYRAAAAYARPSARRSWKVTGAIPPRVFRHRVRVAARQNEHFEPRSGCRIELAIRRAGATQYERRSLSPAAASAAGDRYASPSFAVGATRVAADGLNRDVRSWELEVGSWKLGMAQVSSNAYPIRGY